MTETPLLEVRVARKLQETPAISSFELVSDNGAPLPPFSAGAHIDVHLPGGLTRQYSLCSDPQDSARYLIGVLLESESRGGSRTLHTQVQPGHRLRISAPKNHFALLANRPHSLLLAGGIGVTPLLSMAECLAREGADFRLHYCTRSAATTAFGARIAESAFAAQVQFHFDDGAPEQALDLAATLARPAPDAQLYVCGPRGFMDAVLTQARAQGWREEQLHYEYFGGAVQTQTLDHGHDSNGAFQVVLARSGQTVDVAAHQSVTQALAAAGVPVMTACEQGVCGTCLTGVLAGLPDHRDSYLTAQERAANDQFLPCCSRALGPALTLDL